MGMNQNLLKFILVFTFVYGVLSTPPDDPIECSSNNTNCTITNSYAIFPDRTTCKAAKVLYPSTEEELVSMVASAARNKSKVKVATRFSHSIPKLVCPDGRDGVLISTKYLNTILKIDVEARTMTVESGVLLRDLIDEAARFGLALPCTTYWWGLTIGGLLGTGAHGSSLWGTGGAVHERVVGIRIVTPAGPKEGYAKVRNLSEFDEDLSAAKVSLGVLGVISQVTLKLEALFKRSITYVTKNDSDLVDQVLSFGQQHEFGDITWFPSQLKAMYRIDLRVPTNTSGNGLYDYIPSRSTPSATIAATRTTEEIQEVTRNATGKCLSAISATETMVAAAYGLTNNGTLFTGYPVIGFSHRMQSSGSCLDSPQDALKTVCSWDPRIKGLFFYETAFSIGLSVVKKFIKDVQKLVALEPQSLCGIDLNGGILLRYIKASSAYLGKTEDSIDFDFVYYRSRDPMEPRLFEDIYEEIEQMGLFKYGGLPHWGKNRNLAFKGVINKYHNAVKFLSVKQVYDPQGIFSNEWTDQVLGLKNGVTMLKDGCALEGLCICSEDRHCAPSKGYFCRPGRLYMGARVCRRRI
ncbi:hypothetical protein L6164_006467 [Bauhinia variegata]|uniref:Uncharacterized protein n=1 Tax=Bauhinia variegata TaxID=167791 RepID=A0ACB9PUI7_BAUVA|nr:hypothetical protein L6164_006467 [Bauhinia variegata]